MDWKSNCTPIDWKHLLPSECYVDAVLFMMSFISFISSIAVLGIAERFHPDERYYEWNELLDEKYFTLSTYIQECYHNKPVVVTLVIVSLWFLFFSMICTGSSFMRVLRKHRYHDKPVQPTVTTHDADDNKIPITMGPASYTYHTRDLCNITASDDDDAGGDGGGGVGGEEEEVEERKGKLLYV
jgi:hypothetical protein